MAGDLPRGMVALLYAGAHADAAAPCGRDRRAVGQPDAVAGAVRALGSDRERASSAERDPSPHASLGARARLATRVALGLLAALRVAHASQARAGRPHGRASAAVAAGRRA